MLAHFLLLLNPKLKMIKTAQNSWQGRMECRKECKLCGMLTFLKCTYFYSNITWNLHHAILYNTYVYIIIYISHEKREDGKFRYAYFFKSFFFLSWKLNIWDFCWTFIEVKRVSLLHCVCTFYFMMFVQKS